MFCYFCVCCLSIMGFSYAHSYLSSCIQSVGCDITSIMLGKFKTQIRSSNKINFQALLIKQTQLNSYQYVIQTASTQRDQILEEDIHITEEYDSDNSSVIVVDDDDDPSKPIASLFNFKESFFMTCLILAAIFGCLIVISYIIYRIVDRCRYRYIQNEATEINQGVIELIPPTNAEL